MREKQKGDRRQMQTNPKTALDRLFVLARTGYLRHVRIRDQAHGLSF